MTILWEFDEKHPKQVSAYANLPHCVSTSHKYLSLGKSHPFKYASPGAVHKRRAVPWLPAPQRRPRHTPHKACRETCCPILLRGSAIRCAREPLRGYPANTGHRCSRALRASASLRLPLGRLHLRMFACIRRTEMKKFLRTHTWPQREGKRGNPHSRLRGSRNRVRPLSRLLQ